MRVLLFRGPQTPYGDRCRPLEREEKFRKIGEGLALGLLSAVARNAGHQVSVVDGLLENSSVEDLLDIINQTKPDLIGISVTFYLDVRNTLQLLRKLPQADRPFVVLGGHVATFVHKQFLDATDRVDCIIRGEGEQALTELLSHLVDGTDWRTMDGISYRLPDGSSQVNPPRPQRQNLDDLPFPHRHYVKQVIDTGGLVNITTSRGCYGNCLFCSVRAFEDLAMGKPWRGRSAVNVVDELEMLYSTHGVRRFMFVDDNYAGPGRAGIIRMEAIAKEIVRRKLDIAYACNLRANDVIRAKSILKLLSDSGLSVVFIGIESGSDSQLAYLQKHTTATENEEALRLLDDLDIGITQGFILFDHRVTVHELKQNLAFVRRTPGLNLGKVSSRLLVYHGTPLWDQVSSGAPDNLDDFKSEILLPFENPVVGMAHRVIDDALGWGTQVFNRIEELWYAYHMQYRRTVPKESLVRVENRVKNRVIDFAEWVLTELETMPTLPEDEVLARTQTQRDEMIDFLLEMHDAVEETAVEWSKILRA